MHTHTHTHTHRLHREAAAVVAASVVERTIVIPIIPLQLSFLHDSVTQLDCKSDCCCEETKNSSFLPPLLLLLLQLVCPSFSSPFNQSLVSRVRRSRVKRRESRMSEEERRRSPLPSFLSLLIWLLFPRSFCALVSLTKSDSESHLFRFRDDADGSKESIKGKRERERVQRREGKVIELEREKEPDSC